jgi:signal transduction histidine kinase
MEGFPSSSGDPPSLRQALSLAGHGSHVGMTADAPKDDRPERALTDESLRTERQKADRALADDMSIVEEDADEVVRVARDNADAVLLVAREKADEHLVHAGARGDAHPTLVRERALADDVLRDERASEDESLRLRRAEQAQILARLLPLEREKTDRYLMTERLRSDDALANRDDFLSIVSHDLRNLLAGVVLSATILSEQITEGDEGMSTRLATDRIQRYAARMNRLIGDLLDVGSIDAGRLAVMATRGDLTTVVTEALDTFAGTASAKAISLEVEHLERPLLAGFDHDRMLQVLANLISNAIKFTAQGGRIVVRCEGVGDAVQFAIRDNGVGIPDTMLESVFERFWQVGKNDRRGLGLGLYISRCIIEAHGGTIWAESTLGEGSRFCFRLPAGGLT